MVLEVLRTRSVGVTVDKQMGKSKKATAACQEFQDRKSAGLASYRIGKRVLISNAIQDFAP